MIEASEKKWLNVNIKWANSAVRRMNKASRSSGELSTGTLSYRTKNKHIRGSLLCSTG